MEIPTNEINNELDNLADTLIADESQPAKRIKVVLDAMDIIKAQALEIRELQAVVVRLRENTSKFEGYSNSTLACWILENKG